MSKIVIVDYGMGNLGSIQNMFKRIKVDSEITGDVDKIANAKKILLPGVGAFDAAMQRINEGALKEVLVRKATQEKVPVLGICLGMQLLTKGSDEGKLPGLGWVPAYTHKFPADLGIKIPHMGWTDILPVDQNPLWQNLPEEPRFYFVHTYHFLFQQQEEISAMADYSYSFACAFHKNNIYGTQFHPEKSHKFGMKVLENFSKIN